MELIWVGVRTEIFELLLFRGVWGSHTDFIDESVTESRFIYRNGKICELVLRPYFLSGQCTSVYKRRREIVIMRCFGTKTEELRHSLILYEKLRD